jgi:SAM-dependent methyltransferase
MRIIERSRRQVSQIPWLSTFRLKCRMESREPLGLLNEMMTLLNRLAFNLSYICRPRWDTEIPAPEIIRFINGKVPGNAIDIGCGTGTNLLYLAQHKWTITGIDFAPLAINKARKRLKNYSANLFVADVTKLYILNLPGPYDLAIDMGCFHSLSITGRKEYIKGLEKWLIRTGVFMVYSFQPSTSGNGKGITKEEMTEYFREGFTLLNYEQGKGRPSAWYYYEKK